MGTATAIRTAPKSVMVVEDEGLIALDLRRHLENFGYRVPVVEKTAAGAIRSQAEHLPDLILMDIHLKGQRDGIDAAAEIRKHSDVPIIFVTAFADSATIERAKVTEPFGYIVKPFIAINVRVQIEIALYKSQVERKLRETEVSCANEATLVKLLQSVSEVANRFSIGPTAQTCLERICRHAGWPVGHFFLVEKDPFENLIPQGLWHVEERGRFAAFLEASDRSAMVEGRPLPSGPTGSGQPQILILADGETISERTRAAANAGLKAAFVFPVLAEGEIVGVMEFFSTRTEQPDEEFLAMMGHVGSELGQAFVRQRAAEELRKAAASAESANAAKTQFLSTMSHELRTPMNAMLGIADLLSESTLGEEQRHYVDIFQKAGANLLSLVNDILDLSKVESGHVELESIGFDLPALLETLIEMMVAQAHSRDLQLTLETLPGVPMQVVGDPARLRQILLNLVGNALKFTERGSVSLRVEPEPTGEAGWLRFNVVDSGIGFDPAKTELMFERFTQADASVARKYGGTGLGLAICKDLVELMGGRIGCMNNPGPGSTFFVSLQFGDGETPGTMEPTERPAIAPSPAAYAGPKLVSRILIVEDADFNVLLMKAYLKDTSFELDFAGNGQIAIEKVKSFRPHLVFMDLQMPVMDGFDATRSIRQWEVKSEAPHIPILALTAHTEDGWTKKSLDAGCTECLAKPIKQVTLLEAISRYLKETLRIAVPKSIADLVPEYLAGGRLDMGMILVGLDNGNFEVALRLGHQLKGSGESYGFPEITRAGAAIEVAAMAANETEIRVLTVALAAYLNQVA
jgi:signal transduction histidine kinase/DNA-binding response OmpR family regulator